MMKKAIIYGAGGQDGHYLIRLLEAEGVELINISRSGDFLRINITDYSEVSELVRRELPDYIFHFAAQSTTNHGTWEENHQTISTSTLYLLEAVKRYSPGTRVFLSGSGLQFRNEGRPIKESDPFEATSQYGVNRIHTVYLARYYRLLNIKVYFGYFFNHDSPLRSPRHVSRKITDAVKRIKAGSEEKIMIGDPSVKKEWGYAGDIVKAVWTLVNQERIFEATIGTGEAFSIEDWIKICFQEVGLDPSGLVEQESGFVPEYKVLVSDPATIFSLGWQPETSICELARIMIRNT
jgi:GDPmannose 4,6-dehydratase